MKRMDMEFKEHKTRIGDNCPHLNPSITEDTIFYVDDEPVGLYIKTLKGDIKKFLDIANAEFRGDNVPKSLMERADVIMFQREHGITRKQSREFTTTQYSTVLGSMVPKTFMMRPYPSISAVHQSESAETFVKAMLLACKESEAIMEKELPSIYHKQKELINDNTPAKWRFGNLFTSSISNYNISAKFHRDNLNLKGCVNVIMTKRFDSKGGYLHIPDYDITIECADNSMIIYPAWKNVHGVTPIEVGSSNGYRNTFIFYALRGFKAYA